MGAPPHRNSTGRWLASLVAWSAVGLACPLLAHAQAAAPTAAPVAAQVDPAPEDDDDLASDPHTVFMAAVRFLALPAAELCPIEGGSCVPAETALGFGLESLGRWGDFGFGAGFTYAFGLRSTNVVGAEALEREHARSYLVIEGQFRYYLPRLGGWEWWLGASTGGVVVSDRWTTLADREPYADTNLVGPKALTLSSEGLALGLGVGGHWRFADQFVFGTHLRYANWLLPTERERTPVGDLASLAGRIDVIDAGVVVGFLLPL